MDNFIVRAVAGEVEELVRRRVWAFKSLAFEYVIHNFLSLVCKNVWENCNRDGATPVLENYGSKLRQLLGKHEAEIVEYLKSRGVLIIPGIVDVLFAYLSSDEVKILLKFGKGELPAKEVRPPRRLLESGVVEGEYIGQRKYYRLSPIGFLIFAHLVSTADLLNSGEEKPKKRRG